MVSAQPSSVCPEAVDVVITFRSRDSPIYVLVDAVNHWEPQLMNADANGEAYEHVITVPRSTTSILYKFRVGESTWVHDEGVHTEPDNFGGWNNRFEIPELPEPHATTTTAPSEFSEDTELESTLGVESIADTVSEYDEPVEFIDVRDVEDPEFPPSASTDTPSSESSLRQWLGYGVRSKY